MLDLGEVAGYALVGTTNMKGRMMKTEKYCPSCKEIVPIDQFYRNWNMADGLAWTCKACALRATKKWKLKNADKVREYGRRWRAKNRAKHLAEHKKLETV